MRALQDMTIGQRIGLTVIIVLVILFALALAGWITGGWDETPAGYGLESAESHLVNLTPPSDIIPVCGDDQLRERTRELMLVGLDEALRDRIHNLFDVWMRDENGQPGRASRGVHQTVSAYIRGHNALEKWDLPPCRSN
jgi:hypothetical protein